MAAGRLVDELLRLSAPYRITVIGDEPQGSYNRILLSSVLAEETTVANVIQKDANFYATQKITFLGGQRVVAINAEERSLTLSSGNPLHYDELVIATGSRPATIPAQSKSPVGVMAFRTLDDVATMIQTVTPQTHALVVGGGLLGLEAAYGLAKRGATVTLVHRSHHLLSRQLDPQAGAYLKAEMAERNIRFQLGTEVATFDGGMQLTGVTLTNGQTIECSLAVVATGITPNTELAHTANLATARAIIVDEALRTSVEHISALGECSEYQNTTFGLVDPIWRQCECLAQRLAGLAYTPFDLQPVATKLKVSGVSVFSAGEHLTQPEHRCLVINDPKNRTYRKLLLKGNQLVGIVLYGDTRDGLFYFELMNSGRDVSADVNTLLFGQAYCQTLTGQVA